MTGDHSQAHVIVSAAKHVLVLSKHLGHQALLLVFSFITGLFIQFCHVFWDWSPADLERLPGSAASTASQAGITSSCIEQNCPTTTSNVEIALHFQL